MHEFKIGDMAILNNHCSRPSLIGEKVQILERYSDDGGTCYKVCADGVRFWPEDYQLDPVNALF